MCQVLNDALGEYDLDSCVVPEIPCYMANKKELDLIVEYCDHFDYDYGFDELPIPIPVGGKENRD